MTRGLPQISTVDGLLALMRENPGTRIAGRVSGELPRAVIDYPPDEPGRFTVLARVVAGSAADHLLVAAEQAAAASSGLWSSLPFRYHEFYDACLLPEHPDAPAASNDPDPPRIIAWPLGR